MKSKSNEAKGEFELNLPPTYSRKLHNIGLTMLAGSVPVLFIVHPLAGIALMALGFTVIGWTTRDVKVST